MCVELDFDKCGVLMLCFWMTSGESWTFWTLRCVTLILAGLCSLFGTLSRLYLWLRCL